MDSLASLKIAIDSGDIKKAQSELSKLGNQAGNTEKATQGLSKSFFTLENTLKAGTIYAFTKQLVGMADTMTSMQNKLRLVTKSSEELATVQNELFKIAQKTRQGFAETADTYSNFAIAMGNMGKSQSEVLRTVETINKAIAISGGTTQQAAAATMQLGQAFASGTLRGDELNSILENSKGLAQAIADGMGVAIGDLRKLGSEGKITAEILATALEKSAKTVDEKFSKTSATVGQAMTQMENSILDMIGTTDQATGTTNGLSDSITYMAETITNNKAGIVEFGKDTFRTMQLAGTGVMLLGTEIVSFFNNIPLAITLTIDTLTAKIENSINSMLRGTEDATNKVKGLFGGDKVSLGKVSISTSLAKDYESSAQYLSELSSDLIKTSESLQKDIFGMTTVIKNSGGLGSGGAGAKGGATAETEKQKKARLKALEEEAKIQRGYLESYAELQANQALENYNNELTYLNAYADLEAQKAIDQYNMELGQLQDLADKQAGYALDLYNAITPDSQKIIEKYTDIFETMKDMSVETLASFAEQMNQELDKIKIDTFKIEFDTEGLEGLPKAISAVGKAMSNLAKEDKKYQENKVKYQKGTDEFNQNEAEHTSSQIKGYSNLAGAMSNMFKEGSKEAQAMQVVQSGLALVEATLAVVHAGTSGDVYTAIPRMIATATMVGTALSNIGESYNGGSSSAVVPINPSQVENVGTGTILGSIEASQSIVKSLDILSDYKKPEFHLLASMEQSLKNIDSKIGGVTSLLLRTSGFALGEGGAGSFGSSTAGSVEQFNSKISALADKRIGELFDNTGTLGFIDPILGIASQFGGEAMTKFFTGGYLSEFLGGLVSKAFGGGTSFGSMMSDYGIQFNEQLLTSAMSAINASAYQTSINALSTDGGWLGDDSSMVWYDTQFQGLSSEINNQFTQVLSELYKTTLLTGDALDTASIDIEKNLSNFIVSIGKISLQGKTGEEIQEQLSNVFGAVADNIATAAFPLISEFQKVGEGTFETLMRVATGMEVAESYINKLGDAFRDPKYTELRNKQGDIGLEALRKSIIEFEKTTYSTKTGVLSMVKVLGESADELYNIYTIFEDLRFQLSGIGKDTQYLTASMITGAGGIDELQSGMENYIDNFMTESEQLAYHTSIMTAEFAKLGLSLPTSSDAFKSLVQSIDISTESGQELYGRLIVLSDGFSELSKSSIDLKSSLFDNIRAFISELNNELQTKDPAVSFYNFTSSFNDMVDAISEGSSNLLEVGNTALKNARSYLGTVTATATANRDIQFAKAMLVNKFSGVIAEPEVSLYTVNNTLVSNNQILVQELQALKFELTSIKNMTIDQRATTENSLTTLRGILGSVAV